MKLVKLLSEIKHTKKLKVYNSKQGINRIILIEKDITVTVHTTSKGIEIILNNIQQIDRIKAYLGTMGVPFNYIPQGNFVIIFISNDFIDFEENTI